MDSSPRDRILSTDEENLQLQLLSRLEQLTSENALLKSTMKSATKQNDVLESKVMSLDSELEEANAEIRELGIREESIRNSNSNGSGGEAMETPILHGSQFSSLDRLIETNPAPLYANDGEDDDDNYDVSDDNKSTNYSNDNNDNINRDYENSGVGEEFGSGDYNSNANDESERYGFTGENIATTSLPPSSVIRKQTPTVNPINDESETAFFENLRKKTLLASTATDMMGLQNKNRDQSRTIAELKSKLQTTLAEKLRIEREFQLYRQKQIGRFTAFDIRLEETIRTVGESRKLIDDKTSENDALRGNCVSLLTEIEGKRNAIKKMQACSGKTAGGLSTVKRENVRLEEENRRLRRENDEFKCRDGDFQKERRKKIELRKQCEELLNILEKQQEIIVRLKEEKNEIVVVKSEPSVMLSPIPTSPAPKTQGTSPKEQSAQALLKKELVEAAKFSRRVSMLPI